ncbi:MAG: CvpA family protein [Phycisphaerales bacterium]|nr:MAG: CvpA family protein [Phycisphaerales bacterium]
MYYVFNIMIIGLVAFIAYWWANQGLFSAILHCLCVIVAGAIALAVWEPLAFAAFVKGSSGFSNYGWGITLVVSFALILFILRVAMDRLAPANVALPNWANLTFGLPVGAVAGVLTLGIFVIGAGFIQSSDSLLGFRGYGRGQRTGNIEPLNQLWLPVHQITDEFYSWLSVTSLSTSRPMRHYYPELHKQMTLVRDSAKDGRAALALAPDAVNIRAAFYCPELNRCAVAVGFNEKAQDYGSQLTLSRSQIRLIGAARRTAKASVTYPDRWRQDTVSGIGYHTFENDKAAYITSVAGRESTDIMIQFPAPAGQRAAFIQIRGTRFAINPREVSEAEYVEATGRLENFDSLMGAGADYAPQDIQNFLEITTKIHNLNVGTNSPLGTMQVTSERFLREGEAHFSRGGERPPRTLAIEGIYQPQGTKVVLLDISQESPASIFGAVAQLVQDDARLALVDSNGRKYSPIGFIHYTADSRIHVKLSPGSYLRTIDEIPSIPRAGGQTLKLVFRVTEGMTIVSFTWGEQIVGHCNLPVR